MITVDKLIEILVGMKSTYGGRLPVKIIQAKYDILLYDIDYITHEKGLGEEFVCIIAETRGTQND
jgi:hypothetical protein